MVLGRGFQGGDAGSPQGSPHECGFSLRVIRRRAWTKKGKRKKVNGQRKRGRVNVMGALRYNDKKRVCFMSKKGNSETFHEQLKKLHEEIRLESCYRN